MNNNGLSYSEIFPLHMIILKPFPMAFDSWKCKLQSSSQKCILFDLFFLIYLYNGMITLKNHFAEWLKIHFLDESSFSN